MQEEMIKGNLLDQLESEDINNEREVSSDEDEKGDPKFGFDKDTYERCLTLFNLAKRGDDSIDVADYVLNQELRSVEDPN